jgi:hypothetical protein
MQLVIQYYEQQQWYAVWQKDWNDKIRFRCGGAQVFVGRPPVKVELLHDLSCSSIVIAPHLSRRGPNGLWILSRGANHPLEQAFRGTRAYYLKDQQTPVVIEEMDLGAAIAVGRDLLKMIASVDIIDIGTACFPISKEGRQFCDESKVASVDAVLDLIKSHEKSAI